MDERFDDQQLRERIRSLRSDGLSTNAIARELGVARGRIAPLVRELARERTQRSQTLVDTYCLGVKDALGPRVTSRRGLERFASRYSEPFDGGRVEAPVELARHLVWGGAAYAVDLGFEPHPDFWPAAGHLEALDGPSDIGFGLHGKPSYVSGPFDDVARILDHSVGMDSAHVTLVAPLE
ncbi:MAG: hypothetical protein WEB03_07835 [Nitriliruptor sp.]|uniref:helix-turn-helix domain-containing protein n=1 Tax=Nitriliruptor sp. TaxID=2448056 RepID=UPI0034A07695